MASDALIWLAYMAIPAALVYFVRKRRDVPFHWLFVMFGMFIISCGFTHFFDIWTFYDPMYRLWGLVKGITAVVSLATVVALIPAIPRALALPGLAAVNDTLKAEVCARAKSESTLRESQDALQRSEERLRLTINTALDGVVSMDDLGHITGWNAQAEAIFGYGVEEVIGHELSAKIIPARFRDAHSEGLRRYLATGEGPVLNRRIEVTGLHRSGREFPIELAITPLHTGESSGFSAFVRDISARKNAEEKLLNYSDALESANEALRRAHQEAQAANHSKSAFLANMSHEIRTPMTALLGFVEVLDEPGITSEERQDAVKTIRRNGEHLLAVINDILDLSKIESGRMELESIPCKIREVVSDATSLLRHRALDKGLDLRVESSGFLPDTIRTDPIRVRQILMNLLGNAIKFTEKGFVRLTVRMATSRPDGNGAIQFEVADSGIGMTTSQAAALFQPFTQADSSTTRRFGGTGLGLAISKRLAHQLGGDLEVVESSPAKGSCFRLTISAGDLSEATLVASPNLDLSHPSPVKSSAPPPSPVLNPRVRVLLAEDGLDNQKLIEHVCRVAGFETCVVENGALAVEKALEAQSEGKPFHVILMDMQMPVMDGYVATQTLRRKGYAIPVVALTAHAMAGDREKCLAAGCDDYATKPINRLQLIQMILRHSSGVAAGSS